MNSYVIVISLVSLPIENVLASMIPKDFDLGPSIQECYEDSCERPKLIYVGNEGKDVGYAVGGFIGGESAGIPGVIVGGYVAGKVGDKAEDALNAAADKAIVAWGNRNDNKAKDGKAKQKQAEAMHKALTTAEALSRLGNNSTEGTNLLLQSLNTKTQIALAERKAAAKQREEQLRFAREIEKRHAEMEELQARINLQTEEENRKKEEESKWLAMYTRFLSSCDLDSTCQVNVGNLLNNYRKRVETSCTVSTPCTQQQVNDYFWNVVDKKIRKEYANADDRKSNAKRRDVSPDDIIRDLAKSNPAYIYTTDKKGNIIGTLNRNGTDGYTASSRMSGGHPQAEWHDSGPSIEQMHQEAERQHQEDRAFESRYNSGSNSFDGNRSSVFDK